MCVLCASKNMANKIAFLAGKQEHGVNTKTSYLNVILKGAFSA